MQNNVVSHRPTISNNNSIPTSSSSSGGVNTTTTNNTTNNNKGNTTTTNTTTMTTSNTSASALSKSSTQPIGSGTSKEIPTNKPNTNNQTTNINNNNNNNNQTSRIEPPLLKSTTTTNVITTTNTTTNNNNTTNTTTPSSMSATNTTITLSKTSIVPTGPGTSKEIPTIKPTKQTSILISIGSQHTHQILNIKTTIRNNNNNKQYSIPTEIVFERAITPLIIKESQTYIINLLSKAQYQVYCSSNSSSTKKALQSSLIKNVIEGFITILENKSIAILIPYDSILLTYLPSNKILTVSTANITYEYIIFIYNPL